MKQKWQQFIGWLDLTLYAIVYGDKTMEPTTVTPVVQPTPTRVAPPAGFHQNIITWAKTIEIREGGQPENQNMRLNNPGNLRATSYTKSFAGYKSETPAGFCVFDTYQDGLNALCHFLTDACNGLLLPYPKGTTIAQFTLKYAQPPDGLNSQYAESVATALRVSVDTPIDQILG